HHSIFYSFNATAPSVIYTLSLHDALPICFQLLIIARQTYPTSSRMFSRRRPCPFEDHTSHRRSSPIHSYPDDTFQSPSRPHLELVYNVQLDQSRSNHRTNRQFQASSNSV